MKATQLLKAQHEEVAQLFKALEAASDTDKEQLFLELASKLTAHDRIEREIFYPSCEDALGMSDVLGAALVEHGIIELGLFQANEALGEEDFAFKVAVLKELVEHHVEEEEKVLFPRAEKALGDDSLSLLGREMEAAFAEAVAGDFREPLYENLRQVLEGALQTAPKKSSPVIAKRPLTRSHDEEPAKSKKTA